MKRVLLGFGSLACAATALGAFATARAQTDDRATIVLSHDPVDMTRVALTTSTEDFKDGVRASAASKREQSKVDLFVSGEDLSAVFQSLAKNSGLHIIVADDVKGASGQVTGANLSPDVAVQLLCNSNNLAWGKAGKDTYLIVKQQLRVTFSPAYKYIVPRTPGSMDPYTGQPPQADQKNFRLWLLNRDQTQVEK